MCVCLPGPCPGSGSGAGPGPGPGAGPGLGPGLALSVCLPGPLLLFILLSSGPLRTRGVFILGALYILIIVFCFCKEIKRNLPSLNLPLQLVRREQ